MREKVILECTKCMSRNYTTTKKKGNPRIETMKYCSTCGCHTLHKETR